MFDEDLNPIEEDEPTLEEIIAHRVKDQVIELNVKLVDDEQLYWINISDLNVYYPRAVKQYMEINNLDESILEERKQPTESATLEEDHDMTSNYHRDDDESEAGGVTTTNETKTKITLRTYTRSNTMTTCHQN